MAIRDVYVDDNVVDLTMVFLYSSPQYDTKGDEGDLVDLLRCVIYSGVTDPTDIGQAKRHEELQFTVTSVMVHAPQHVWQSFES